MAATSFIMLLSSSQSFFIILIWILLKNTFTIAEKTDYLQYCNYSDSLIDCSNRQLTKAPNDIPQWTRTLKLNKNLLTEIPNFPQPLSLVELSLGYNNITSISREALEKLESLTTLDLNNNEIQKIRVNDFPTLKKLTNLSLTHNQITNIENGSFAGLTNLIDLKLNRNKLSLWDNHMFKDLRNLQVLELNRNQFSFIGWYSFKGLNKLSILKLRHNNIGDLNDGAFYELSNLYELHLDYNLLPRVDSGWLYALQQLKLLNVSNNRIQSLNNGWESCPYLEVLDVSNNLLESIPRTTFNHLNVLSVLKLQNNRISFIENGAFEFLPSVQILDLSYNHISWIVEYSTGVLSPMKELDVLLLSGNSIFHVAKGAFTGLDRITIIDLQDNPISGIEENPFRHLSLLKELYINSSSLICDCSLKWLNPWMLSTSIKIRPGNLSCLYPIALRKKSLNSISQKDFICAANDHPHPQITIHPEDGVAYVGSNVTLRCGANSSLESDMKFIWKVNNHRLDNAITKRYESAQNPGVTQFSDLLLTRVIMAQNGHYQCVVSNNFGVAYSKPAKLTIYEYPFFTNMPTNVVIKAGGHARLDCGATGIPPPTVIWQKDNGVIFPAALEKRMQHMGQDESFFITNVKAIDAGTYICRANNSAGTISANATLTVLEPPVLTKTMKNKQVKLGDTEVLECFTRGYPKPKTVWLKNGKPLTISKRHYLAAEDQLLFITDAVLTDTGEYECEVNNSLGSLRAKTKLAVDNSSAIKSHNNREDAGMFAGIDLTLLFAIVSTSIVMGILVTSVFWVSIIYYNSRKSQTESMPLSPLDKESEESSQSSKDSGTGDSTRRSYQDLLLVTGTTNHSSILHGSHSESPSPVPEATLPLLTTFHPVPVDGTPYNKEDTYSKNKLNSSLTPIHYQNKPTERSIIFCSSPASSNGGQCTCLTGTFKKKEICDCFSNSSPIKHNYVVKYCNGISAEHEICCGDISKRPCSIPVPFHTSHSVSTNCCRQTPNSYLCLYMPQSKLDLPQ